MVSIILYSIGIVFLICFLYWSFFRPTSLWTGFFFIVLICFSYGLIVTESERISLKLAIYLVVPIIILVVIIGAFGIFAGVIALFWNERILIKREGRSLSNMLPLIVAIGLILFEVAVTTLSFYVDNIWFELLSTLLNIYFIYGVSVFFFYFVTSILYNRFPFYGRVDYIIVLGAGLTNGERVTPLLASRIDAAVHLFKKQNKKYNTEPTIILSGGKGTDEKLSEAQAMLNYLEEKKESLGKIYLEDKSTTTKENLQFSEKIIYKNNTLTNLNKKNIVVASSNYHTLRAGKIASNLGIFVRVVGSKTKAYYFPTAFIREYIAYLAITKKKHLIFFGTVLIIFVLLTLIKLFFNV